MENEDITEINKIIESIRSLKTELGNFKADIKADIKEEFANIKSDLKSEIESIKSGEFPSHDTPQLSTTLGEQEEDEEEKRKEEKMVVDVFNKESSKKTEEFILGDFSGLHISGAFEVEITQSNSYGVNITAEEALFRNLDVSKQGEILRVHRSKHVSWRAQLTRPKARITLPLLKELKLSGATRAAIKGFNSSDVFKLELSGASSVEGEITTGDAVLELSGASRTKLTGSAKDTVIKVSGASRMDLRGFSVRNAAVKLSGASHVAVKIDGRLDARLSGGSHFSWIGNPVMGDIRTSGASRLSKE